MGVQFEGEIKAEGIDLGAISKPIIGNATGLDKFTQG